MDSPAPAPQSRRKRSARQRLVLVALLFALAVVGLEGVLRLRSWKRFGTSQPRIADAYLGDVEGYSLLAPIPGASLDGELVSIHINSMGFRGEEFPFAKQPGELRIACVGGSTTFCAEASHDSRTWPARLQAQLRERYPERDIRVINAGVPGYRIEHSLRNLRERVLPLRPDVVVLYHAHNDIIEDSRAVAVTEGLADANDPEPTFSERLADTSMLYMLLSKNLAVRFGNRGPTVIRRKLDHLPLDVHEPFVATLDEIHAEVRAHGARLVLATFSTKVRPDQSPDEQRANADIAAIYMPWISIPCLNLAMDRYNAAILAYAEQHDLPIAPVRDAIPADGDHFADYIHLTDKGCERMASAVGACLVESGVLAARDDVPRATGD